jgi:hypothetical protein
MGQNKIKYYSLSFHDLLRQPAGSHSWPFLVVSHKVYSTGGLGIMLKPYPSFVPFMTHFIRLCLGFRSGLQICVQRRDQGSIVQQCWIRVREGILQKSVQEREDLECGLPLRRSVQEAQAQLVSELGVDSKVRWMISGTKNTNVP